MAKAIVCIGSTQMVEEEATISYTVTVLGPPNYSYSGDFAVDMRFAASANLLAWQNKIIKQAAERKVLLAVSDVIVFGGPN